ncbi:MAG TPA: BTAD domain-containing putative transcriptional regulator [Gaiellaceae bacterium]|nr:BTAD domain-containing putative transcriptional regulator [Gaiellaceae bacterium]
MANSLAIRLLGPFEVVAGGRQVDVTGTKRHGLLALLALHRGRVLGADELIDALWGSELPASPRNALQHHVARLRAALGQETIVASGDGYALSDAAVDALRFEELLGEARVALREGDAAAGAEVVALALALWRGPALQGLTDTTWFSGEARRLEALRVDALEEQFEAALALGEHREIASALRAAVEENPFRERLWGQLMLALYRSGRQADALDTFQEARGVLAHELGLEPGPDLQRLQAAILAHDPTVAPVHGARRRRGNLPARATSFVDREEERAQVVELLREHRLVTLTGPPGVGKSRLALEVARSLEAETAGGTWLVDLTRAARGADVVRLTANAVAARGRDPLARVIDRLRDAEAILLFDACEHVLEEAARVVSAVLDECRDVRVLATSREVLHLAGEARLRVEPLRLPVSGSTDGVGSPAVQLFAARAQATRPGFELDSEAARLVAEITRRVDGLPLAIELAAARVNVLGLGELLSIVERRMALLDEGTAAEPGRTSLRSLVEWSYDLLHTDEKTLLHHLAVHRGGASRMSLLALAAKDGLDEASVTYLLGALVEKSIVSVSFPDGEARYDVLDTVREYALDRLAEGGGLAAAREAHAQHFATLADAARKELRGPEWQAWLKRLELEHDNLWAALTHAREAPDPLVTARLGAGLGWYFGTAERVSEGRAFIENALASAEEAPLPLRVEMLAYVCYLATEEDDLDAALEAGERGLALATAADAPWETAMVRLALAFAHDRAGPHERAVALAEEARRGFEELGDTWGAASSALTGAVGALVAGDTATATALAADAARLHANYDVGAIPAALLEALLAERCGDAEAAAAGYRRMLERSERAGFTEHASFALSGLGSIAFAGGDIGEAEEMYRRALAVGEAASAPWLVAHAQARLAQVLAAAGDAEAAATLYRGVIAWSEEPRQHAAREALFVALVGSPVTAALLGLAELAEAGGDAEAADELRARAGLALA